MIERVNDVVVGSHLQAAHNSASQESHTVFESAFRILNNLGKSEDVLSDGIGDVQESVGMLSQFLGRILKNELKANLAF